MGWSNLSLHSAVYNRHMRVHRFYTGDAIKLKKDFWLRDEALLWQWNKVLRFRTDQQVILFDGAQTERLYKITEITRAEAHLEMVTELKQQVPEKHVYLFWSLLKKDNNDLILQKCTELGVSNFVPLISERSIRDNFNIDRARKIVREASEQCGRGTIPTVREPVRLETALPEYLGELPLFVCQQGVSSPQPPTKQQAKFGLLIGPEGGWSDSEKAFFETNKIPHLHLSSFTLRAETAAITAAAQLLQ